MRASTLLTSTASLFALANARIVGFSVPETIVPDTDVKVLIRAENYIQTTQDVAFSFGLFSASTSSHGELGTYLDSKFLGRDDSNIVGKITHYVHIPAKTKKGNYVFTGAHFSLIGALFGPEIDNYVANVTVGDNSSPTYVDSVLVPSQA